MKETQHANKRCEKLYLNFLVLDGGLVLVVLARHAASGILTVAAFLRRLRLCVLKNERDTESTHKHTSMPSITYTFVNVYLCLLRVRRAEKLNTRTG